MKVAVVTPVFATPPDWLARCLLSVREQSIPCTHFVVLDGEPSSPLDLPVDVRVLRLPGPHHDAGNAARAAGSVCAVSQGFDAVAYLDADNWFDRTHLESLVDLHHHTQAAVCTSGRLLMHPDGHLLGPCPEVDGTRFVDTSCLLLTRAAFSLIAAWYLMPRGLAPVCDRVVWQRRQELGLSHAHTGQPTMFFRTRYRVHFDHFGVPPPPGCKRLFVDPRTQTVRVEVDG